MDNSITHTYIFLVDLRTSWSSIWIQIQRLSGICKRPVNLVCEYGKKMFLMKCKCQLVNYANYPPHGNFSQTRFLPNILLIKMQETKIGFLRLNHLLGWLTCDEMKRFGISRCSLRAPEFVTS